MGVIINSIKSTLTTTLPTYNKIHFFVERYEFKYAILLLHINQYRPYPGMYNQQIKNQDKLLQSSWQILKLIGDVVITLRHTVVTTLKLAICEH